MFRLNHRPLREINLTFNDTEREKTLYLEYESENVFNAYHRDENGFLVPILMKASFELHPTIKDRLIVHTEADSYHVDFFLDETGSITQLDYEGAPLNFEVRHAGLVKEQDSANDGAPAENAKSPMPGTVVKVFVQPGQEVKKGESLVSVESMKMEYLVKATHDGIVGDVLVKSNEFVAQKQILLTFK